MFPGILTTFLSGFLQDLLCTSRDFIQRFFSYAPGVHRGFISGDPFHFISKFLQEFFLVGLRDRDDIPKVSPRIFARFLERFFQVFFFGEFSGNSLGGSLNRFSWRISQCHLKLFLSGLLSEVRLEISPIVVPKVFGNISSVLDIFSGRFLQEIS